MLAAALATPATKVSDQLNVAPFRFGQRLVRRHHVAPEAGVLAPREWAARQGATDTAWERVVCDETDEPQPADSSRFLTRARLS
jgi:hypothetical protein